MGGGLKKIRWHLRNCLVCTWEWSHFVWLSVCLTVETKMTQRQGLFLFISLKLWVQWGFILNPSCVYHLAEKITLLLCVIVSSALWHTFLDGYIVLQKTDLSRINIAALISHHFAALVKTVESVSISQKSSLLVSFPDFYLFAQPLQIMFLIRNKKSISCVLFSFIWAICKNWPPVNFILQKTILRNYVHTI